MRRAVFLDRDGTIIEEKEYLRDPDQVAIFPGAREALKRLQDAGTATVMPLGSPIGSNRGIETRPQIEIIIEQATVPVVVDAGLGAPSQAAEAMEMGADAVLVNTAIAIASDPVRMAQAFKKAIEAGREAHEIGLGEKQWTASPTSPLTSYFSNQTPSD